MPENEDISFIKNKINASKKRAEKLKKYKNKYKKIWTKLEIISCWADFSSENYINDLNYYFANIYIQAKGLIATEAIISFPLIEAKGCVLAYQSHFLEFYNDNIKNCIGIAELEKGEEYYVVITTGGGLYRYNLKDKIIVISKYKGLPVVEFVGRKNTLDLVGEKLDEIYVKNEIQKILRKYMIKYDFILFAGVKIANKTNYCLYIESNCKKDEIKEITHLIEQKLRKNYHYNYARNIEQLNSLEYLFVKDGRNKYIKRCLNEGMILGDIKVELVDRKINWQKFLVR